jgi:hypothetical protein
VWVSSTARPTGRKQGAALHHYGLIHAPCQAVAQTTVGIHQVLTMVLASSRIDNLNAMVTYGDLTEECNEIGQQLVRYIVVDDAQPNRALTMSNWPRYSSANGSKQLCVQKFALGARNDAGGYWAAEMSTASKRAFGRLAATSPTQILCRVSGANGTGFGT